MARQGSIQKNEKVKRLNKRFNAKRAKLRAEQRKARTGAIDMAQAFEIQEKMNKIPRNSAKERIRNRCNDNGRPRAYSRKFGINRYTFRLLALEGKIPGVVKSSW